MGRPVRIVQAMKRAEIVSATRNDLCVAFHPPFFQVVDDVEVVFDDSARLIHFGSGSRDLGETTSPFIRMSFTVRKIC
ncbi:MAG: DUF1499 domain-containing protein [Deltaproteobacteria bacterium]|nr:DUF1499 domain-containing protein [Deltaproteobacteria bacterium]